MRAALAAGLVVACVHRPPVEPGPGEIAALRATEVRSPFGMVATGTVDASRVGAEILERGGNAVDAAVAAAFTLAVVDPGDSGLGGMTLALVRLADGRAAAIDGACTVPIRTRLEALAELQEGETRTGIEFAAVPGSLAALAHMSERYGTLPLAEVIAPAIEVATNGFTLSEFQVYTISKYLDRMQASTYLRFMVLDNGSDLPKVGTTYFRPQIRHVLEVIADGGPAELHGGSLGVMIGRDMLRRGGFVTVTDLAAVRAREMTPVWGSYRGYEVLSYPSPGAGETVVHALNMLERFPQRLLAGSSVDRLQVLLEVFRISRSDGKRLRPDPNAPERLRDLAFLDKSFAADRAATIEPGRPFVAEAAPDPPKCHDLEGQTTHISAIDRWGNVVSMTQTLGNFFGCQTMHPELGITYNNMLSGACDPVPRSVIPCDMSPTIVAGDDGTLLALGSAGSSRIPAIVALVVSNVVDRGMGLGPAIDAPRVLWGGRDFGANIEIFADIDRADVAALAALGYDDMRLASLPGPRSELTTFGGVNAAARDGATGALTGVGDVRRLGVARGARR